MMQVYTLLDATGSMAGNESRVVDGFREYLRVLAESEDTAEAAVTLATFNSVTGLKVIRNGDQAKACRPIGPEEYVCDEITPLYDAIAESIGLIERRIAEGEKVVFVINTDGLENASRRETRDSIFKLIEDKKAAGWQFVFLGADIDAWAAKDAMGMSNIGLAASYAKADFVNASRTMAQGMVAYASTGQAESLTAGFGGSLDQGATVPSLTPSDVATIAGTTPVHLARLRQQGKGPSYVKLGHKTVRYTQRDVDDWLAAAKTTTKS